MNEPPLLSRADRREIHRARRSARDHAVSAARFAFFESGLPVDYDTGFARLQDGLRVSLLVIEVSRKTSQYDLHAMVSYSLESPLGRSRARPEPAIVAELVAAIGYLTPPREYPDPDFPHIVHLIGPYPEPVPLPETTPDLICRRPWRGGRRHGL